jgi:hypothetical protein
MSLGNGDHQRQNLFDQILHRKICVLIPRLEYAGRIPSPARESAAEPGTLCLGKLAPDHLRT